MTLIQVGIVDLSGIEDFKVVFQDRIRMMVGEFFIWSLSRRRSRICVVRVTSRATGFSGEGARNP